MWHNGLPPVRFSSLPPGMVSLRPGRPPEAACPACGRWLVARRSMLPPHRTSDGQRRCRRGSGLRLRVDLTPGQWRARLEAAARDAATRRGPRLVYRRSRLRWTPAL